MTIEELRALSKANEQAVKRFPATSYVKFIQGKMKKAAENGRTSVTEVFRNMDVMPVPTRDELQQIIEIFQKDGYRVEYDLDKSLIKKVSWSE